MGKLSVFPGADPNSLELLWQRVCGRFWAGQPGSFALNYRAIAVIFTLAIYKWKFFPREEYSHVTQQVGNGGCEGNCIKFCSYNMISLLVMKCNQSGI